MAMSPGLLQLFAVRSDRQTHAASTVGAECCGKADHRSETSRTHHTDIASTSLVAGQTVRYSSRLMKFCSLPQVLIGEKVLCHSCSVVLVTYVFAAAGPRIWNNFPASLRDKEVSCTEFRRKLKTFMFQTDCGAS